MQIKVIGIDAAFVNCGIALGTIDVSPGLLTDACIKIESLRLITTEANKKDRKVIRKNSDDLRRARELVQGIREAVEAHDARFACVEVPTGAQSARAAWLLGMAVGVLASIPIPVIEVTPREVKEAVGDKYADKETIIKWAHARYPHLNWPTHNRGGQAVISASKAEHMADAVAALHAAIRTEEMRRMAVVYASYMGPRPPL